MAVHWLFWRKAAARSTVFLLCITLFHVAYFWHNGGDAEQPKLLNPRFADADSIAARSLEFQFENSNSSLIPRDTYQCGTGNPCSNGACCGGSGYCGYGPTYCGSGCVSNCNAVAECGQYASPAGKTCPLNTCCSQYGFCGTTSDFCGTGCQSNCVLNPSPPGGGSSTPILQNKVIGYYESWSGRHACHQVAPTDLPLDALTHVNYAFAYIDPSSYQVVTMDTSTSTSTFQDTANIKSIKPSLTVFVSIGGWSFSDNGTATQPLYSTIAADASKRQTFANNVVHFMKQYGFDGLDIDWEYPGAPDRGGQTQDTANYVALLQTLRQTFDASGNKFGLTFTAPSSYWYLRWFDLPNMIKYADWINLMSYDLHGVWDSTDPIGSIVQGHTNLTEIKLAAELFWRVNIPPAMIVLGFGFYGRAFTLSSTSCSSPGCAFSGASNPGPCTATGGILGYYEILDILKSDSSIKPTHDTADAVNYFTYNNNQWVSYDDSVTFAQKVQWANSVGLGGAMIWASDLDDDKYTAHSALLGRTILSNPALQNVDKALSDPQSVIQNLAGNTGQNCFAYKDKCVNLNDNNAMARACGDGFTAVGWDDADCGTKSCHCGKPICCPTNQAPQNCIWRGDHTGDGVSSDCSAQCNPGEINIQGIGSSWGGGFLNDGNTDKCARGYKVFCCPDPDAGQITQGCGYAPCRTSCGVGTTSLFSKADNCWIGVQQYCCPVPTELTACHWVTKTGGGISGDCANAKCNATELEVDASTWGDGTVIGCDWGRKQAACCSVEKATPPPSTCSANLCKLLPGVCTNDGNPGSAISKRELMHLGVDPPKYSKDLAKRGGDDVYTARLLNGYLLVIVAVIYPEISRLYQIPNANQVIRQEFRLIPGYCLGPAIQEAPVPPGPNPPGLNGFQTEHPLDRQISGRFIEAASNGLLRGRNQPNPYIAPVNSNNLQLYWDHPLHQLGTAPAVGSPKGAQPYTANDRMMEAFGSDDWPAPLMPTDQQINGPKGNLMNLQAPIRLTNIRVLAAQAAASGNAQDTDNLLQSVRIGFAIFEYINNNDFATRFNLVRNQVRTQLGLIENAFAANGWPITGLQAWWDVFLPDFLSQVEGWAQSWTTDAIAEAAAPFLTARGSLLPNAATVINTLRQWENQLEDDLVFGPFYGGIIPQPPPPGGGSP